MKLRERLFLFFILGALFFFSCHRLFYFKSGVLEKISSYIAYPILLAQKYTVQPVKNMIENRKSFSELENDFNLLLEKSHDLQAENVSLQGQLSFYDDVEEVVEFKKRYQQQELLFGQIIFRMISDQAQVVFVSVGSEAGAKKDMVAVYKNCLLGRVEEVYPYYSRVILITDKRCKVAAYCCKTKSKGICQGLNLFDNMNLCFVEHFNSLKEGDLVLSDGSGFVFPRGFGLGKIKSFEKNGLHYSVQLDPIIDLKEVSHCYFFQKSD